MAKPRVFISSTFYDLRQIREDLERFILEIGYEPVRNETGAISYGRESAPESYAYKEVQLCDIIVTAIGGRYGTQSSEDPALSITQKELRTALEGGIQVFIFIEANVLAEYETYKINKENDTVRYHSIDNKRIFEYIEFLYGLPKNNPIAPFSTGKGIEDYLRNQWAGLFQRFLAEQKRAPELKLIDEMKAISSTLHQTVKFLTEDNKEKKDALGQILLLNHPAFQDFAKLLNVKYRVSFVSKSELDEWFAARSYKLVDEEKYDVDSKYEWSNNHAKKYVKIKHAIFDKNGDLKYFAPGQWKSEWVELNDIPETQSVAPKKKAQSDDIDIPF